MKLTDLKEGQTVILDGGFTCVDPGPHTVHHDAKGFFLRCRGPFIEEDDPAKNAAYTEQHYLDGQEDENGELVGVSWP